MKRYWKILLICSQKVLEQRMKSIIWFIMTLVNPLVLILFWKGALQSSGGSIDSWVQADFNSYYLMLVLATNILVVHIEDHIAYYDIRQGFLSGYLIRPFSYYWMMFFNEMPYRILQGTFGVISVLLLLFVFKEMAFIKLSTLSLLLVGTIVVLALFISFTFKVIVGLLALWTTQIDGVRDTLFVVNLVFGGYIIPLQFFPEFLKTFIYVTPYPWITYYPVISLQGKADTNEMMVIIGQQILWLIGLYLLYKITWKRGIKKFTAVGQ